AESVLHGRLSNRLDHDHDERLRVFAVVAERGEEPGSGLRRDAEIREGGAGPRRGPLLERTQIDAGPPRDRRFEEQGARQRLRRRRIREELDVEEGLLELSWGHARIEGEEGTADEARHELEELPVFR